ncbi:MAG: hypothetical protein U9R25_04590 [Chloroflexota bacterium]|nr:hypothetical protein [Chloroflexota bacterium]
MDSFPVVPLEAAVLNRLLRLTLDKDRPPAWRHLQDSGLLFSVAATYFLLHVEPRHDVERFTVYTLGRLLNHLNRRTEQHQLEYRGQIRGRIAWSATIKARYADSYDPSRYVCREVRHQYDTPENQLAKSLAEQIDRCLRAVPAALRQGVCYFAHSDRHRPVRTAVRLGNMQPALDRFRRNVVMRGVSIPAQITEEHLERARNSKLQEYRTVATIHDHYTKTILEISPARITAIGRQVLPLPGHLDPQALIWIELAADILRGREIKL